MAVLPMDPRAKALFVQLHQSAVRAVPAQDIPKHARTIRRFLGTVLPTLEIPADVNALLLYAPLVIQIMAARYAFAEYDQRGFPVYFLAPYNIPSITSMVRPRDGFERDLFDLVDAFPSYGPFVDYLDDAEVFSAVRRILRTFYHGVDYETIANAVQITSAVMRELPGFVENARVDFETAGTERAAEAYKSATSIIFGDALWAFRNREIRNVFSCRIFNLRRNHWVAVRTTWRGFDYSVSDRRLPPESYLSVEFYDSIYRENTARERANNVRPLVVQTLINTRLVPEEICDEMVVPVVEKKVQPNGVDCGYMAALFCTLIPRDRPVIFDRGVYRGTQIMNAQIFDRLFKTMNTPMSNEFDERAIAAKQLEMSYVYAVATPLRSTLKIRDFWPLIAKMLHLYKR